MKQASVLLFFIITFLSMSSCRKDDLLTDSSAKLTFSADSVLFDTVFTSIGSTTRQLMIYNTNNRPLKISTIRLAGGSSSPYRLNLDGVPGKSFTDVEIPGNDSLFLFVEITIDPGNAATPFIVQDSVVFEKIGRAHV